MEKIMTVASVSEVREFKGNDGNMVKVIDVTLSDGINTIIASAVDKKAQHIIDHPIAIGALVQADFTFSVSVVKTEKGEFPTQRVRLNAYGVIVSPT